MDKINNVSYDQTLVGRLLNFGHVEIQTAAHLGATDYYKVNNPKRLKDTITGAEADYQRWQYGNQAAQLAWALKHNISRPWSGGEQIATELEKLYELKNQGALTEEEYDRAKSRLFGN